MVFRYSLSQEQQIQVEKLIRWCRMQTSGKRKFREFYSLNTSVSGLPITFLLGFYVSLVLKRWWEQYCKLPWPDTVAIYLKGLLVGAPGKERVVARMMRRTVIRYCLLAYILCIRRLSSRLKKRFPTMCGLVKTGIVRPDEAMRIGNEESTEVYGSRWWIPLKRAIEILTRAKKEGYITSAPVYSHIMGRLSEFLGRLTKLQHLATCLYPWTTHRWCIWQCISTLLPPLLESSGSSGGNMGMKK